VATGNVDRHPDIPYIRPHYSLATIRLYCPVITRYGSPHLDPTGNRRRLYFISIRFSQYKVQLTDKIRHKTSHHPPQNRHFPTDCIADLVRCVCLAWSIHSFGVLGNDTSSYESL